MEKIIMSNYVSLKITQLVPEILFNIIRNKWNIPSNKVKQIIPDNIMQK